MTDTTETPFDRLFYKPADASRLLSRGLTKVNEALRLGELKSVKVGGSRLIPAEALAEYAEKLKSGQGSEK